MPNEMKREVERILSWVPSKITWQELEMVLTNACVRWGLVCKWDKGAVWYGYAMLEEKLSERVE